MTGYCPIAAFASTMQPPNGLQLRIRSDDIVETKRIQVLDSDRIKEEELKEAAQILREGGLVAFPTETVYGLGANALDEEAAKKISMARGIHSDNPFYCPYFSSPEELEPLVLEIPDMAES